MPGGSSCMLSGGRGTGDRDRKLLFALRRARPSLRKYRSSFSSPLDRALLPLERQALEPDIPRQILVLHASNEPSRRRPTSTIPPSIRPKIIHNLLQSRTSHAFPQIPPEHPSKLTNDVLPRRLNCIPLRQLLFLLSR